MAAERKPIDVSARRDLSLVLQDALETGEPILMDTGDTVYEVEVVTATPQEARTVHEHDPLLGIIGILDEGEPTDIARFKDRYLADAIEPRHP